MEAQVPQSPLLPWATTSGSQIHTALREALSWCERFSVAANCPTFENNASSFWQLMLSQPQTVGGVYLSGIAGTEPELIDALAATGRLRLPRDQNQTCGNLVWFEREGSIRLFVASGTLNSSALGPHCFPWLVLQGSRAALDAGFSAILDQLPTDSYTPTAEECEGLLITAGRRPVYRRLIRAVSDVLPTATLRSADGFIDLNEDDQVAALWSTLFGEGLLDLEQAIRLSAQRLRAQGLVTYQALRQRGELYRTIEERLISARRSTDWFDRPKPGHIRAIEPDVDKLGAEDWRDCLLSALREHPRVERSQAVRLAFEYARDVYGLDAQRLRGGGRPERAIKSAVNSGVRQKYLQRDGAMYLINSVEYAQPELRGVIEAPTAADGSPSAERHPPVEDHVEDRLEDAAPAPDAPLTSVPTPSNVALTPDAASSSDRQAGFPNAGAPLSPYSTPVPDVAPLVSPMTIEQRSAAQQTTFNPASHRETHNPGPAWAVVNPDQPAPYVEPVLSPWLNERADTPPTTTPPATPPSSRAPISARAVYPAPAVQQAARKPLFEQSLQELEFPARTLNWAASKHVETVGQLVAWNPADLGNERNMGRLTLERTRAALEEALGCTWEQAWQAHEQKIPLQLSEQSSADEDATTAGGSQGWASFGQNLDATLRESPLSDVELPARMRNWVTERRLTTIGELLALRYDELRDQPNLGRKSLNDTLDALADFVNDQQNPVTHATFLQLWRAQLVGLKPMHRLILSRRSGMQGPKETLEQLGAMLGITRERVRQLETSTLERLQQKSRVLRDIAAHLDAAFGGGHAVSLELLNEEPWWQGIADKTRLLQFVFERVLNHRAASHPVYLFEAPSGKAYVTRFAPTQFDETLANARARLSKLEFPTDLDTVSAIVADECSRLDAVFIDELDALLREELLLSDDGSQILGVGVKRSDEVVAFLNAQDSPVPVAELEERFGRGAIPEEVLYFKRGVVGLQKHFPDFDEWMQKLVPACLQVLETRAAGRQWLVPDLHEELQSQGLLPDWLGHWHLASLLRRSEQVEYLGRLRVALRGSAEQRLQFEDVFAQLLEEAGGPLPVDDLMTQARLHTDVRQATADLMLKEAPFVRLDKRLVGLVHRDIPGGPEAVAQAVAVVSDHLTNTQTGVTPFQAQQLIAAVSPVHAEWSLPLVKSVLRSEATLRIDRSKNIGLSEWDDARCPARGEFLRREVMRGGGSCSVDGAWEQMRAVYGSAPDRPQLAQLASQVGLVLDGSMLRLPSPESAPTHEAPTAETAAEIGGIPAELLESLDELLSQPALDPATLAEQVQAHVQAFEEESRVNEFVDLPGAQQLATQSHELLKHFDTYTPSQRALAQAAIRYFVIAENVGDDFDIGGLDDDKKVMAAVLQHLGLPAATVG